MTTKLPLYLSLLLLTQCSKCKDDPKPQDPASQLPPATQTGANTFGCLVNGQPYTPQGRVGLGSNFDISYDPGLDNGNLSVGTYNIGSSGSRRDVFLNGLDINHVGVYTFGAQGRQRIGSFDAARQRPCDDYDSLDSDVYCSGMLTITRLDLRAGIISGTFAATLARAGCDTLKITQGRFDGKL